LRATGAPELDQPDAEHQPARAAVEATEQLAREHASMGSVWFQNSVRGAAGLAIAVYIAQRTGLQHGFWVVLGTLSVLRSNALGTGRSILSALAGTAVGIVIGAPLVIGIGTHQPVLWGVLPVAILLAAYAPRAISFAAGQAGFTVVLFILFSLIQPVGWRVGLVRVEDVAIGFAISLGVGLLFWPRGAAARLREDLAAAYARGADYVVAAARQLIEKWLRGRSPRSRRCRPPTRRRPQAIPRRALGNKGERRGHRRTGQRRVARPPRGTIPRGARTHGRRRHATRAMRPEPRPRTCDSSTPRRQAGRSPARTRWWRASFIPSATASLSWRS
jgi:hypothetical protein